MIQREIAKLIQYGLATGLIGKEDAVFTANRILELLKLDTLEEEAEQAILAYAADKGVLSSGICGKVLGIDTESSGEQNAADAELSGEQGTADVEPSGEQGIADAKPSGEQSGADIEPSGEQNAADAEPSEEQSTADTEPSGEQNAADAEPSGEQSTADTEPSGEQSTADAEPSGEQSTADAEPSGEQGAASAEPSEGQRAASAEPSGAQGTAVPAIVRELPDILGAICDFAYEQGLLEENTVGYRDLFDTKVMGLLADRPSNIIRTFWELYRESPKAATDFYYKFSQDTDYIRRYRIARDMKWVAPTEYGDLDITINLSKPEKDPKAIAAARNAKQSSYPKCLLCMENEGYAGRLNHPARQNHRIIPVTINGSEWGFQYSPYVYYNEHCIVFNKKHVPMKIERATFAKLLDFVGQFPHYIVGSNADLPIVGGSILSHDHFQGGSYEFPMAKAPVERALIFAGYEDVEAGIVKWPMSVLRIRSGQPQRLIDLADKILLAWRGYTHESAFIFAETDGEPHNTITPIARKKNGKFELDLVLRNNITTKEHPLGVYHPHAELHHIKKENIGLIEVMGLAVLPARLKSELQHLKAAMLEGRGLDGDAVLASHAAWARELEAKYDSITPDNIDRILRYEVGLVFSKVLEHAGVYKRTPEGQAAFLRFVESVDGR